MAAVLRRGAAGARALRQPRSLGAKLVLILTGVGIVGALGITALLASLIIPSFNTLEARSVDAHVERTRAVLAEYASKVESAVRDYGDWNASYDYMAHPSRAFERESFSPLAMANLGVSGMAYLAPDRRVVIARWIDTGGGAEGSAENGAARSRFVGQLARIPLSHGLGARHSRSFYLRLGDEVAAVAVAEVRRSDGSGQPRGWVAMARQLPAAQVASQLQLAARLDLGARGPAVTLGRRRATMRIGVPIIGPDGQAIAAVSFSIPRDVSLLGQRMLMLAAAGTSVLLLIVLLALRRIITSLVLRPLHRIERHMQMVRQSGSLGLLDEERRDDEIGSLGRSFNSMLRQLKDLREQIEAQSFALGRTESAVAVMHNVRNALNPISTILSQGIAQPAPVGRATLDRAVAELARDDLPAARRGKLAAFVAAAIEAEERARAGQVRELEVGREAMTHVLEIIGQQQRAAHERPVLETCDVVELVTRNASIARNGGVGGGDGSIGFTFPAAPCPVLANRVILSQVIGNLFSNAAESIVASGAGRGTISVAVACGETVEIAIRDTGEGFDPEVGRTLFQRGFSTRPHKSGGLGLHWCANSMVAMEGSLRLESEGRGQGATAILTLRSAAAVEMARAA